MLGAVCQYSSSFITSATTRIEVSTTTSSKRESVGMELNKLANRALEPLRYLVGGESLLIYTSRHGELLSISRSVATDKSWVKTALKLVLIIPMTVIGIALKAMAIVGKEARKDLARAVTYSTSFKELQVVNQQLAGNYVAIVKRRDDFNAYLEANRSKGASIWEEKETVDRFDTLFEQSIQNMKALQQELTRLSGGDSHKMADLLLHGCRDAKDPIFSFCFFRASVCDIYDYCRNFVFVESYTDNSDLRAYMQLVRSSSTEERQKAFFTEHTPFYKWRLSYQNVVAEWNALLQKKDANGNALEDLFNAEHKAFHLNSDDQPLKGEEYFETYDDQAPQQKIPSLIKQKLS